MNVLIVDDNKTTREFLKNILLKLPEITIVHEASNNMDVHNKINNFNYDIVFLDVDLGEDINGIELGRSIKKTNPKIQLIFSTAYREFAVEAFELEAIDYLLKPFNEVRIMIAINKVKKSLLNSKNLTINIGNYFLNVNDIIFIEKIQKKLQFVTKNDLIDAYDTLNNIEKRLPKFFQKTHRSFLVNTHEIKKITSENRWNHKIEFYNTDRTAILSRDKYKELSIFISNLTI